MAAGHYTRSVEAVPDLKPLALFGEGETLGSVVDAVAAKLMHGEPIWYRGESKRYPTPAMPAITRGDRGKLPPQQPDYVDSGVRFPLGVVSESELTIVEEIQSDRPPDPYFYRLVDGDDDAAWLAFARHQDMDTRLLDVTRHLLVAIYFACRSHKRKDGYVFAFVAPENPNPRSQPQSITQLFDVALGHVPTYRDFAGGTELGRHAKRLMEEHQAGKFWRRRYLFESVRTLNAPMAAQGGAFLWRADAHLSLLGDLGNAFSFQIGAALKKSLLRSLRTLGIDDRSLHIPLSVRLR